MGLKLFDSTFFVDLDRESRKKKRGPAIQYLLDNPHDEIAMSVITRAELARGFQSQASWAAFCSGFTVFPLEDPVLWAAAEIYRDLRKMGIPIADNDLWIAATAVYHGVALVTDDRKHFERIKGLNVVAHR